MQYNVEIYRTKITSQDLNNSLLLLIRTLRANGDKFVDKFPMTINPIHYEYDNFDSWKAANQIDAEANEEQAFEFWKKRYSVNFENIEDVRNVIALRYLIETTGYSATRSVTLAKKISNTSRDTINVMSTNFPGISTSSSPTTYYPYGNLACHILGYVGPINDEELAAHPDYDQNDYIGKAGIEKSFEKYLKGTDGVKQIDMSVDGIVMDEYISTEAVSGCDIVLTIDKDLQYATEVALERDIMDMQNGVLSGAWRANEGAAVVMNVKTGEVLAMASYPNYNPSLFTNGISTTDWNNLIGDTRHPLVNKAISDYSAPGSTFKIVTAIAGLESGAISTSTSITCTGKYTFYQGYQPVCWYRAGHGAQNVTSAIEHSCNYFFYDTGRRAGIEKLNEVGKKLGLGSKTGIELPDEVRGELAGPETDPEWAPGKTIQAAIGQSNNTFTPIQMCKYTAMVANGGRNLDVTIVKSINKPDGTEVSRNDINAYIAEKLGVTNSGGDLSISAENFQAIRTGMRGVTSDDGGTAVSYFRNFNIEVAGKTGSASVNENRTNALFIGFAPYDDPEIAVAVYIKDGEHGGYSAPVARDIFAQYFGMNNTQITEDVSISSDMESIR